MNDEAPRRFPVLLAIAAGMGLVLVALIIWTALSQNRFGLVATIEAYDAVDGSERWTAQFDVDYPPHLANEGVLLISKGTLMALGGDGEVRWKAPVPGCATAVSAGNYVAVRVHDPDHGEKVVVLDATNGTMLWEHPGLLLHTGTEIVAVQSRNKIVVVAARSGGQIARVRTRTGNGFIAGDATAAFLSKEKLTVFTVDGDSIDILSELPENPRLEAIDGDVVVLSRQSDEPGRTVEAYDIETGAQMWQERQEDYERPTESIEIELLLPLGNQQVIPFTPNLGGDGGWIVFPAEGPPEATAAVGEELTPIEGSVRYFRVADQTFAVDAASGELLWTDSGRFPAAATEGLAALKYKKRYTIVSAATGEKVAVVPRQGRTSIEAAGGRFVISTGSKIVVVESDGTTRDLAARPGVLTAASAQYAVVSKASDSSTGNTQVTVLDLTTGAEVFDQAFEREYGISLDGEMLIIRHRDSTTTVDLTTEESTSTGTPNPRPTTASPDLAVVVFNPDGTRLLWTMEISQFSSVRVVGDAIVIATPEAK